MNTLLALILSLTLTAPVWAAPIDHIDTWINPGTSVVQWSIQFTRAPDLVSTDTFNRQADSFQILTYDEPRRDNLGGGILGETVFGRSVIRGEEIHYGGGIPVRNMPTLASPVADPNSGGWGSIIETAPIISQDGLILRFQTSLAGLHVQTDHPFGYGYMALRYGDSRETGTAEEFFGYCQSGQRCDLSVPVPAMLWPTTFLGLAGLGLLWWREWRRAR